MTTKAALLLSALLVLAGATGCATTTDKYCGALEDEREALTDLARSSEDPGGVSFADGLVIFEGLRDESPGDVRDEWDTFYFAWQGVVDAFEQAGTSPQDYRPGQSNPGVTPAQAKAVEDAAAGLLSQRVVDAGEGIEQHAQDVCKVDLGL